MKYYFDSQQPVGCWWLGFRFIGISAITTFLILAVSDDVIGVLGTFFGIEVKPGEALSYVTVLYLWAFVIYLSSYLIQNYWDGKQRKEDISIQPFVFIVGSLISVPMLLIIMSFEAYHPFTQYYRYLPNELETRRAVVTGFTTLVIFVESFGTASYDLWRQLKRQGRGDNSE